MNIGPADLAFAEDYDGATAMRIPESLSIAHEDMCREFTRLAQAGGHTGAAAKAVADLLQLHLLAEEECGFALLGCLGELAAGRSVRDTTSLIAMAERLKAELPKMLSEHKAIAASLERFTAVAAEEGHPESVRLAERLNLLAQTEEEVLYPAAVLVGEYLKEVSRPEVTPARWPARG
jgi:hypothetical protein